MMAPHQARPAPQPFLAKTVIQRTLARPDFSPRRRGPHRSPRPLDHRFIGDDGRLHYDEATSPASVCAVPACVVRYRFTVRRSTSACA
jgi:hypothetical protein